MTDEEKYKLRKVNMYYIGSNFPKISRKTVPIPIVQVKYEINLAAIEEFRFEEDL